MPVLPLHRPSITDWDVAYSNAGHVPTSATFAPRWQAEAAAFRTGMAGQGRMETDISYGDNPRHRFDLFRPESPPRGLFVFVHGGYWLRFDKSFWSHFAAGALARGWAVAIPSYRLAPEARITGIGHDICRAIEAAAARIAGPIRLAGHSAGGHLVTRAIAGGSTLDAAVLDRIAHVTSISGVHDLRPLRRTAMNADLRLDVAEAAAESPVLRDVRRPVPVTCWVGAAELPEFVRQNAALANVWAGLGVETTTVEAEACHHFSVLEPLAEADSPLTIACAP